MATVSVSYLWIALEDEVRGAQERAAGEAIFWRQALPVYLVITLEPVNRPRRPQPPTKGLTGGSQPSTRWLRGGLNPQPLNHPYGQTGSALTLLELPASGRSRHGRACEAPVPPVQPMLSPLPPSRLARHLASPQGSSLAPAASLCRSPAPAPPTSCTATRDAPPSRTACIRYSRRAFATTWIACHCKRARSRAVKVCRAG